MSNSFALHEKEVAWMSRVKFSRSRYIYKQNLRRVQKKKKESTGLS